MKFARFEANGEIFNGMAEADEITVIRGSFFNQYEMTDKKYSISEISFL